MFLVLKFLLVISYVVLILFCVRKLRKIVKKSMYSYRLVSTVGVIFFMIGLLIHDLIDFVDMATNPLFDGYTHYDFFFDIASSFSYFTMVLFPFAIIFAIFLSISNIILLVVEGKSKTNVLGFLLGLVLIVGTLFVKDIYGILGNVINVYSNEGFYFSLAVENLIATTLTYFECMMIATIYIAAKCAHHEVKEKKDYVIVLGCRVLDDGNPGGMLKKRVEAALRFANDAGIKHGSMPAMVFSGGQGHDEPISEAKCMKNYAAQKKFKGKMILEDESKTTRQNFIFSKKVIGTGENVAFSTTDFHVFRSGVIATKNGFNNIEGISAKSPWYYYNNSLIREFVANMKSEWKMHVFNIVSLNAFLIIFIVVAYFLDLI